MKPNLLKVIGISFCISFCISSFAAPIVLHQWSGEGDAKDSMGTADGTIVNSVTFDAGQSGQAFVFDGSSYVDCGTSNVAAFGTSDFAISFWVKTVTDGVLLSKQSYGIGYNISVVDGRINCDLSGGDAFGNPDGQTLNVISQARVNNGIFHQVVVERYGLDLYVFVDGVISGKTTGDVAIDMPELAFIQVTNQIPIYDDTGTNQVVDGDGNPLFTNEVDTISAPAAFQFGVTLVGSLDEVQVYDRALTAYDVYLISHPGVGLAIIDQPLNQRTLAGRQVIMHVLALGVPPITYQWQYNGYDIPGAISNNLVLDSPQTFDSGTYTVLVSNPTNDIMSQPATLVVTNLATPTNGLLARWSGEGTANDPFGHHNGVTSNIKYVPGVLGTAFQFNGKSSVRCGNVINGTGEFTIDFWMQTTVTPSDRMAILGQRPYCSATDCLDFRLFNTGPSETFLFAELGDVRDMLNPPFNYTAAKTSGLNTIHLNDGIFHHVSAVRRSNQLSLYVDGNFVSSVYSVEPCILDSIGSFNLGIDPCNGGFIGCLDEVEVFGRALSDQEVYSTYSPSPTLALIRQPATSSTVENQPFSFEVSAAGQEPITYQWCLNGTPISGSTDSKYSLAAAQLTDAGVYTVVVSNPAGTRTSSSAQLKVVALASILPGLVNRWSADGDYSDSMGNALAPGGQTSFAPGVSGQAWDFIGEENIVGVDYYTGQVGYNDFTWAMWIRYRADGTLVSAMPSYRFGVESGLITARLGDGSRPPNLWDMFSTNTGTFITNAPVAVNDDKFHHVAFIRQNLTTFQIYIDGALAMQTEIPVFNFESTWGLGIADDYGRSSRFRGLMDEVELYNRALNPDEVLSLYTKYANGPRSDYVLQDLMAPLGTNFTLHANDVTASGPVSYQWTLNGVPIAGATDSDYTVSNVDASQAGMYAVTMTSADGSISSPIARVSTRLLAGMYNGLFYFDGDVTDDSSGFITLTLDDLGSYSAQIRQKGNTYRFTGKFSGTSTSLLVKRGTKTPLTVMIAAADSNKVIGSVRDGTRQIPLRAHRVIYNSSHPTPQAGSYTLQLVGLSSPKAPNGHGFGNITIGQDGKIGLIANLADDTVVSQGTGIGASVVAGSGVWPLYIPAYAGKGSVMGWLSFTNNGGSALAGTLRWVKGKAPLTKNYKNGFATRIPVIGSTFNASSSGLGIGLNDSSVVADGAKIYNPVSDPIVATSATAITFSQQDGTTKTLSVTPNNGRFSGQFLDPVSKKLENIKGVVLQDQAYAAGYFINKSNLSGRIVLQHN